MPFKLSLKDSLLIVVLWTSLKITLIEIQTQHLSYDRQVLYHCVIPCSLLLDCNGNGTHHCLISTLILQQWIKNTNPSCRILTTVKNWMNKKYNPSSDVFCLRWIKVNCKTTTKFLTFQINSIHMDFVYEFVQNECINSEWVPFGI